MGAATGNVKASLVSGGANIAIATVNPYGTAGISGNGNVFITGSEAATITVDGVGQAYATYKVPTVSINGITIVINYVEALLNGTQEAYMKDAMVSSASGVEITSLFNKRKELAAEAIMGAGGEGKSVSIGGVTIEANTAIAP